LTFTNLNAYVIDNRRLKMKKLLLFLIIIPLLISVVTANTTRDLKSPPDYNPEKIKKLVILYINIERVNSGKPAFVINRILSKAAQWHSDYMSAEEKMTHITNRKGMHDVQERVNFYGEKFDRYAEILQNPYSLSAEGVPLIKKKDSSGEYIDFQKSTVYWLTEFEIAISMQASILKDPEYSNYLSNEKLNSIGGGVSEGKHNGLKAWYASFAIVEKKDLPIYKLKTVYKKETVKKTVNSAETEETVIQYTISGLQGTTGAVLAVSSSGVYRTFNYAISSGEFTFRIDDKFRENLASDEKLYTAVYDQENDIFYPVSRIEVIK